MKWIIKILPIIIAAIFFTGCIEMQTKINLNKDGSGSIEENIFMGKAVIDMIKDFASAFADSTQPQKELNIFEEEKIKAKTSEMGEDVEFVSFELIKTEEKEGYKALYKFKDINKIQINQDPANEVPMSEPTEAAEEKPREKLGFKFTKGSPNRIEFRFPDEVKKTDEKKSDLNQEAGDSSAAADSSNLEQMVKFMKDMKAKIDIEVKGKIVNTNATHVNGNTITLFDIDFNQLISDKDKLENFQKVNPDSFEEVKKLVKDIPGIKVELNKEVFIDFE